MTKGSNTSVAEAGLENRMGWSTLKIDDALLFQLLLYSASLFID